MRLAPTAFEQGGDKKSHFVALYDKPWGTPTLIPTGIDDALTVHVFDNLI